MSGFLSECEHGVNGDGNDGRRKRCKHIKMTRTIERERKTSEWIKLFSIPVERERVIRGVSDSVSEARAAEASDFLGGMRLCYCSNTRSIE